MFQQSRLAYNNNKKKNRIDSPIKTTETYNNKCLKEEMILPGSTAKR